MGSSGDGEFMRWGIQEMGVQELSYQGLTRAVFCVAKAQDTKHAAKQRVSDLLQENSIIEYWQYF